MPEETSEDRLLGGAIRLVQPKNGHRAGTDAVLAARLSGAAPGERIVDLGSASGAIGVMIGASVPETRVVLAERDPALVRMAQGTIALNGLGARVAAAELDAFARLPAWRTGWPDGLFAIGEADLVVTNPPFFEGSGRRTPDPGRLAAHVMAGGGLGEWVRAARRLLRPGGRLVMIHRADALGACLASLGSGFGGLSLRFVHPREEASASRVVVEGRMGSRAALAVRPPLVLHTADGGFTAEAATLHGASEGGMLPRSSC